MHLEGCGHGCKIYGLRPPSCRDFRCAWVEGHGEARDIPDTSGVMLFEHDSQFGDVLIAVDLEFGPMKAKKKALKRIARDAGKVCVLVDNVTPEKIVLAYAPREVPLPKRLARVGVI